MKIGFFELEQWEKDYIIEKVHALSLSNGADLGEVEMIDDILSAEHLSEQTDFEIISVFVNSVIDARVLDHLPKLKLIVTRSTGFDHIDLDLCKSRGVAVANVPSYGEETVAEYTFALLLNLSRKVYLSFDRIRETCSFALDGLRGFDLNGKTLGVVGTGRIGRNVIEIATGFNMKVVAYDPKPNTEYATKMNYRYLPLDEVLATADIITLHVPYMESNHHLIDASAFAKMKKGVYFVNTARGALVDTMALVEALRSGQVAGAGLDVLEEECVIKDELNVLSAGKLDGHDLKAVLADHLLIDMFNVIVTPHNAFNTWEALRRILDTSVEDIKGYISGAPTNLVS